MEASPSVASLLKVPDEEEDENVHENDASKLVKTLMVSPLMNGNYVSKLVNTLYLMVSSLSLARLLGKHSRRCWVQNTYIIAKSTLANL
jgi:hypothetical protein